MVVTTLILAGVLVTSIISGAIGMAGGMILMGLYGTLLPVATAMIAHGITQASANCSRAFLLRKYIQWNIFNVHIIGALFALALFLSISYVPNKKTVFLLLGSFAFAGVLFPALKKLDICSKKTMLSCGFVTTSCQLLAGVSGPALDVFYLNTRLTRQEIVATKSTTQTLGHLLKLIYYGYILWTTDIQHELSLLMYPFIVFTAFLGTGIGKRILEKASESQFQLACRYIVLLIGACYIARGLFLAG